MVAMISKIENVDLVDHIDHVDDINHVGLVDNADYMPILTEFTMLKRMIILTLYVDHSDFVDYVAMLTIPPVIFVA